MTEEQINKLIFDSEALEKESPQGYSLVNVTINDESGKLAESSLDEIEIDKKDGMQKDDKPYADNIIRLTGKLS